MKRTITQLSRTEGKLSCESLKKVKTINVTVSRLLVHYTNSVVPINFSPPSCFYCFLSARQFPAYKVSPNDVYCARTTEAALCTEELVLQKSTILKHLWVKSYWILKGQSREILLNTWRRRVRGPGQHDLVLWAQDGPLAAWPWAKQALPVRQVVLVHILYSKMSCLRRMVKRKKKHLLVVRHVLGRFYKQCKCSSTWYKHLDLI
jgi:hypothetical protein